MGGSYKGRHKIRRLQKVEGGRPVEEVIRELRTTSCSRQYLSGTIVEDSRVNLREMRQRVRPGNNKHLLTVHHKDGNHRNNPPNGTNWENLCVYCHDDEHSRGILRRLSGTKVNKTIKIGKG